MQAAAMARSAIRISTAPLALKSHRFLSPQLSIADECPTPPCSSSSFIAHPAISGIGGGIGLLAVLSNGQGECRNLNRSMVFTAPFSSTAQVIRGNPSEAVKELHGKVLESVQVKRTAPPNALLWSLIKKSENEDDIRLVFDALQHLRVFRLSNLRIHDNFNCHLCEEVAKACARVGAVGFGKKALWKHNVFGLSPSVGSANHILSYAKAHKDTRLMVEVMKLLGINDLPLQPSTADVVFRICSDTDNWELISMYSKKFQKAGVKLRKTSFDTWMEFAVKRGDTESLWEIEKLRSQLFEQHTVKSGLSCAKGFLLQGMPDNAAQIIQVLDKILPDSKRPEIAAGLQKLVEEWPSEVISCKKDGDQKALHASLKSSIAAMIDCLLNFGMEVSVSKGDLGRTAV